jgi:endonuclease YncB( thermonuclease family)
VIDGDTIEIRGQRIRLFGIDAPESRQACTDQAGASYRCGQKAAQALDYRISDGVVRCEPKDRDRYGRVVAVCRAYGEDLSAWMAGLGWALAFRRSVSNTCRRRNWRRSVRRACGAASSCRRGSGEPRLADKPDFQPSDCQ